MGFILTRRKIKIFYVMHLHMTRKVWGFVAIIEMCYLGHRDMNIHLLQSHALAVLLHVSGITDLAGPDVLRHAQGSLRRLI
jgi:hypothetical protein